MKDETVQLLKQHFLDDNTARIQKQIDEIDATLTSVNIDTQIPDRIINPTPVQIMR